MHRCAILDDYQNVALTFADWSPLKDKIDITVFDKPFASSDAAVRALQDFEIVCAMRERTAFSREVLTALPKLKLLLTSGMRNAAFDLETAKECGITVCGTGGVGNATAGLTIGLMLELTRKIGFENARMHAGEPWQTTMGQDVEGMTLGVVGLGKLGTKVATIAKALGMKVIAWSQNLTDAKAAEAGVTRVGKEDLFRQADFLTIHYKLGERSRGLVGAAELALMKPTAYLVNTSRGPVVDTDALIAALTEGRIAGAGVDVYDSEPLPADHPIRNCPRTILTPHLGYVTDGTYSAFYGEIVESIESWLAGNPIRVLA